MKLKETMRTIMGTLVLLSTVLGYFYNINWLFLGMIVGFNLLISGLTKWCTLELILKKLGLKE
jgi:hypothetical protein